MTAVTQCVQVGRILVALARARWSAGDAPAADAALGRVSGILDSLCHVSSPAARGEGDEEARVIASAGLPAETTAGPTTGLDSPTAAA